MDTGNKTSFRHCRFLDEEHFSELYETFIEAYSDYIFQFNLTETQLKNHLLLNGVDLAQSVGVWESDKLIGFSLNGFGDWHGSPTVYDAGTAVVPSHRRRGVSLEMFRLMESIFPLQGIRQMLLEVISTNVPAISLYEKLGFTPTRELSLLECTDMSVLERADPADIEIEEIAEPDWQQLAAMTDGKPSWQNSFDAIRRTRHLKTILGAYKKGECVGFAIFSAAVGRLAQIAVRPDAAGRGIASAFVRRMRQMADPEKPLQVINSPRDIPSAVRFFEQLGFREKLIQVEMIKSY